MDNKAIFDIYNELYECMQPLQDPQKLIMTESPHVTKTTTFVHTNEMGKLTLEEILKERLVSGAYKLTLEKTDLD